MGTLLVAAGGGGDAIAAAVLAHAVPGTHAVGIATMAWDRLIIDPLPGPRSAHDFTDLDERHGYALITPHTRPVPPAGSALPRLAGELLLPLVLLDPTTGATGIRRQLAAAAHDLGADTLRLVDVGGDILGRPGDTDLRSPLADALMAASCTTLPTRIWLAGPGLDGELPENLVLQRIGPQPPLLTLDHAAWPPFLPILNWHPTEATALLAAASQGLRGRVEIRDAGLPVDLTDTSPTVYDLTLDHVHDTNPLTTALADSTTLVEAEQITHRLLGWTELDKERTKAAQAKPPTPESADVDAALRKWSAVARARGIDYATYRRLGEVLGWHDLAALRTVLNTRRIGVRPSPLLWPTS